MRTLNYIFSNRCNKAVALGVAIKSGALVDTNDVGRYISSSYLSSRLSIYTNVPFFLDVDDQSLSSSIGERNDIVPVISLTIWYMQAVVAFSCWIFGSLGAAHPPYQRNLELIYYKLKF